MLTIHIVACCPIEQGEIEVTSLEQATCDIEEKIGLLLQQMFGVVLVEQVSITNSLPDEVRNNHSLPAA